MVLVFDVGNTNIVFGAYQQERLVFTFRIYTDKNRTADEYGLLIRSILQSQHIGLSDIAGGMISSGVPLITQSLTRAFTALFDKNPLIVGPGIKTGLNIAIDDPAELGSDLVASAVAALVKYPCPTILIDMGTATTISVLDQNGTFLGCSIHPGVRISLESLSAHAAALPDISLVPPSRVIGTNTLESMRSGVMCGAAAMLDGMIERMQAQLGVSATVVATGGMAREITKLTRHSITYDENLILEGINLLYRKNNK